MSSWDVDVLSDDDKSCSNYNNDKGAYLLRIDKEVQLEEKITNIVYIVQFRDNYSIGDLVDFSLSHQNCVLSHKCKWRCTHYNDDFTVNIFRHNRWVLASKIKDTQIIKEKVYSVYKEMPSSIRVANKTMIFKINAEYNLDSLFDYLSSTADENEGVTLLDKQRFPAIIVLLKKNENITLEIYHKGSINATGMKGELCDQQTQQVRDYIRDRIIRFVLS